MKPDGPVLRRRDFLVTGCTMATLHEMIGREHYARRGANTATYRHGLYRRPDMRCVGVAWWIPPTKGAAIASWDGDWRRVLSLHRLACRDEAPTNSESFLIGASVREIKKSGLWDCLVTYADESQGHLGTIYRATGWEYLGLTAPEAQWTDSEGRFVARKAGAHTRTNDEMVALGYRMIGRFAKHKFRKVLA